MKWAALFTVAITTLLVGGFISLSNQATQQNALPTPPSLLTAKHGEFDFGQISMAKGKVSHTYELTNAGDRPESIASTETSCMCTEATLKFSNGQQHGPFGMPGHGGAHHHMEPVMVKPGESVQVEVVFDPTAHGPTGVGKITREIMVKTDEGRVTTLAFTAEVRP